MHARQAQRPVNYAGIALVLVGAALVLASRRYLDWYDFPNTTADSSGDATFSLLRTSVDQLGGAGVAIAYFDWLALTLLIAVIVAGWLANVAWPPATALRVLGFAFGFIGSAATYYALAQHANATGSSHNIFHNSTWGLWAAIGGFLFAALGAALGPRTPATRFTPRTG